VSARSVAESIQAAATIDHLEAALDLALELTFPASDPISVSLLAFHEAACVPENSPAR